MHDVKDSRMSVLQLPLTDTAVTKTTQHISAVNSVTEGRVIFHLTSVFSVANEISISEQWQDRTVDEIMKFLSFSSYSCNMTTTFLHMVQADTCIITITSLFLKYNSLLKQTNPNIAGEGPTCEVRSITTRDVFKYKYLLQQVHLYS